jgi:hypothetical protein
MNKMDEIITLVKDTNSLEEVKQLISNSLEKKNQEHFYKRQYGYAPVFGFYLMLTGAFLFFYIPFVIALYFIKSIFKFESKIIMTIYNILTYPTKSIRNAVSIFVAYYFVFKQTGFSLIEDSPLLLLAPWIILYYKFNTEIV